MGDLNGDGFAEVQVDGEIWLGPVRGQQLPGDANWWFEGGHGMGGVESTAAGDFNGDGLADLALGAPRSRGWPLSDEVWEDGTPRDVSTGQVAIFFGPLAAGALDVDEAGAYIVGEKSRDYLGTSLAAADDINGDGADELFVGAGGYIEPEIFRVGAVYLVHSPMEDLVYVAEKPTKWVGNQGVSFPHQGLGGLVVSPGDLTGDGVADALASGYSQLPYLLSGVALPGRHITGVGDLAPIFEDTPGWLLGGGDLDGDGSVDGMVGAGGITSLLVEGVPRGQLAATWEPRVDFIEPNSPTYFLAFGGAVAGDLNGDGFDDFLLAGDIESAPGLPEDRLFLFLGN